MPDFNTRGVAPFEKSDVKKGHVHYDLDRGAASKQGKTDHRDVTLESNSKTRQQTVEDAKNYQNFLNSKKYGSEGPLSGG